MSRWEPNARGRLELAALELYQELGYDQTTVTQIASRAGLTERTFFRHYADKREVLFAGASVLQETFVAGVVNSPATSAPIEMIAASLTAAADLMQERRPWSQQRQTVINANPELQERELIKLAALASALAEALRGRGIKDPAASLAAEAGIAVFKIAFERWVDPANRLRLATIIRDSFRELSDVASPRASTT